MAAMKPRTGDGPMEAEREPRGLIILRVPLEGGGRLVVSVNEEEAKSLHKVLEGVVKKKYLACWPSVSHRQLAIKRR